MSYRRNNKDKSERWLKRNASRLKQLGIPDEIVCDHRRFLFAVQEGWDLESGWKAGWIADSDVDDLLELLRKQFSSAGWDLTSELERRAKR